MSTVYKKFNNGARLEIYIEDYYNSSSVYYLEIYCGEKLIFRSIISRDYEDSISFHKLVDEWENKPTEVISKMINITPLEWKVRRILNKDLRTVMKIVYQKIV